jgi:hypothetical protein
MKSRTGDFSPTCVFKRRIGEIRDFVCSSPPRAPKQVKSPIKQTSPEDTNQSAIAPAHRPQLCSLLSRVHQGAQGWIAPLIPSSSRAAVRGHRTVRRLPLAARPASPSAPCETPYGIGRIDPSGGVSEPKPADTRGSRSGPAAPIPITLREPTPETGLRAGIPVQACPGQGHPHARKRVCRNVAVGCRGTCPASSRVGRYLCVLVANPM